MPGRAARVALSSSHLLTAERIVAGQTALIQRLADRGHDVRGAWQWLGLFEEIQSEMARHHHSILLDLDARNAQRPFNMSAIRGNPASS